MDWVAIVNKQTLFLLALLIALLIWFYKEWTKYFNWWKQQNVPHIKARLIPEGFRRGGSKPLHISEHESYQTYGRIYGRLDGRLPVLTIGVTEILQKVFLKDFGVFQTRRDMKFHDSIMDNTLFILENPAWKRVRSTVLQPLTSSKYLRTMLSILENSCDYLIENLERSNESGEINCRNEFEKFVLHSIGTCAFGLDMTDLDDPGNEFRKYSRKLFQEPGQWRTSLTTQFPELMKFFRMKLLNPESTEFFKAVVVEACEGRKNTDVERKDFLQMIMDAEKRDSNEGKKLDCNNNEGVETMDETPKKYKKELSHEEMLSQCVTFFVAGSDSTSTLLTNVVYQLTKNKEWQEKAYEEIINELYASNTEGLFEALNGMKYLDAIINESLRMVPAMVRLERRCHADYTVEHEGQKILLKKGMLVNIPVYAMHYDEKYYPEPTKFKPERFLKSAEGTTDKSSDPYSQYAFLGFGEGQRKCVASKFVYVWTKLCLAKILEKFEFVECDKTPESLEVAEVRGILRIDNVYVGLKERSA